MSKKLDWEAIMTPHGSRPLPGAAQPKYRSGREFLQKGLEMEKEQEKRQQFLAKAQPAMEALLKCRIEAGIPIVVNKPFQYVTSELVHDYEQTWDDSKGAWVNGQIRSSSFQDVAKSLRVGTELILKGLDPNVQEFIFQDQNGEEVVIPYSAKQGLLMQTNIYEDVVNFINSKGE